MTSLQNLFVVAMKVATKKMSQTLFLLYEPIILIQSCQVQIIRCSTVDVFK